MKFKGSNGVGSKFTKSKLIDDNKVIDEYSNTIELSSNTSPDHQESLSQYHKDGGFMQTNKERADFATDTDNLAITNRSTNASMRDYDKKVWLEKTDKMVLQIKKDLI